MEILVWSLLGGEASGHVKFNVPPSSSIGEVLKLFCEEKDVPVKEDYILCKKNNTPLNPSNTLAELGIIDGEILMFSQTEKSNEPFSFSSWWRFALLVAFFGVVGVCYIFFLYFAPLDTTTQEIAIVIDAGSTHSQLFVFKWKKKNHTKSIELTHDCFMAGGIASFRTNIDDIEEYFMPCIKDAESHIPSSKHSTTPLVLAATAGMRLLRQYDPEGAELILSSIRSVFQSKTNFLTTVTDVFIASGQQEGVNGWAALNYLLETYQDNDDPSVSALDLGGASVQVASEISTDSNRWPVVNFTLFSNTYSVVSKSYLCYGLGEALHRYQYLLIDHYRPNAVIKDPCLPKGVTTTFTKMDFSDPCVYSNATKDLHNTTYISKHMRNYMEKYQLDQYEKLSRSDRLRKPVNSSGEIVYTLKGSSNITACKEGVKNLFNYELCSRMFLFGSCLSPKTVPPYTGELVGFSNIFSRLLPLLRVSQDSSLEEFKKAVFHICTLNATELEKLHSGKLRNFLEDLCFDSMYIYTLLTDGLGVTADRWKNILFKNKIHKQSVAWALGLMLNRTSYLTAANEKKSRIELTPFILLFLLFSSFLAIAALFVCKNVSLWRRRKAYKRVLSTYVSD